MKWTIKDASIICSYILRLKYEILEQNIHYLDDNIIFCDLDDPNSYSDNIQQTFLWEEYSLVNPFEESFSTENLSISVNNYTFNITSYANGEIIDLSNNELWEQGTFSPRFVKYSSTTRIRLKENLLVNISADVKLQLLPTLNSSELPKEEIEIIYTDDSTDVYGWIENAETPILRKDIKILQCLIAYRDNRTIQPSELTSALLYVKKPVSIEITLPDSSIITETVYTDNINNLYLVKIIENNIPYLQLKDNNTILKQYQLDNSEVEIIPHYSMTYNRTFNLTYEKEYTIE